MKWLLRITYALFIMGLYLFIFFEMERIETNKYFNKYGKEAVSAEPVNYSFFIEGLGHYKSKPIKKIEDSRGSLLFFEVFRKGVSQGEDRSFFQNENVVIFYEPKEDFTLKNKYYYVVFSNNDEVVREPLYLRDHKGLGIYIVTYTKTGNIVIPKDYFFKEPRVDNKPITNVALLVNNIKEAPNEENVKSLEKVFEHNFSSVGFEKDFTIKETFDAAIKENNNIPKAELVLVSNGIKLQTNSKIDMFNPMLSMTLFYLAGSILLTYFIFFLPQSIRKYKIITYNLRKIRREREFARIEKEEGKTK